jgi:hypothetical protein
LIPEWSPTMWTATLASRADMQIMCAPSINVKMPTRNLR